MEENQRLVPCSLQVTVLTLDNDTQGLFDFEANRMSQQTFYITNPVKLVIQEDEVIATKDEHDSPLLLVNKRQEYFVLEAAPRVKHPSYQEDVWLVLKKLKVPGTHLGYRLSEGETLRLGRTVLRVNELRLSSQELSSKGVVPSTHLLNGGLHTKSEPYGKEPRVSQAEMMGKIHSNSQCRVCYSEDFTVEDPLVSLCKCSGSLRFLHISCLKSWVGSKLEIREKGPVRTFEWKRLECELCKTEYPIKLQTDQMTYELLEIQRPHPHYMLLEEVSRQADNSYTCFYIKLDKTQVRCGRSHDCPIRVKDISVSRSHATLHISRDAVYIDDNDSKFGTLALINRPIAMQLRTEVALQIGKTVMMFKVRKAWSLWDCFGNCHRPPSPDLSLEAERSETPRASLSGGRV